MEYSSKLVSIDAILNWYMQMLKRKSYRNFRLNHSVIKNWLKSHSELVIIYSPWFYYSKSGRMFLFHIPFHGSRICIFCPTVTREQHPSLPRNSNGRLVFTGPTQEEVWISRCNSRIPPQLLKTTWFPIHRNMRPLPATESQEKSHVSS